jgi:hypothetical protein
MTTYFMVQELPNCGAGRATDAQPEKVAPFSGGNEADVRKSAAGDFFP